MRYSIKPLLVAVDVTVATNSAFFEATQVYRVGLQVTTTGTLPKGTIQLQGSNDGVGFGNIGTAVAYTTAGTVLLQPVEVCYEYLRVALIPDATPGTGTCTVITKTNGF